MLLVITTIFSPISSYAQLYRLGTDCGGGDDFGGSNGFYSTYPMNDRGTYLQQRILENFTTNAGSRQWEFYELDYINSWRAPSNTPINITGHNQVIPSNVATASAYFRNAYGGGDGARLLNTTIGNYYTFNLQKNGYANSYMAVLETAYNPKTMTLADAPAPYGARTATVTLSLPPSTGEYVYIRYTTDNYVNSTIIPVSFVGNIGTATVPVPSTSGVTQQYYAYSSNKTKAQIDAEVVLYSSQVPHDMLTLEKSNAFSNVYANPVVVTSSGGSTLMNTYATMRDAFAAINGGTNHTGIITIAIIGNTNEVGGTAVLNASGTGVPASSYSSIGIQPAGGVARTISGNIAGPLINLNGADNVTIDGREGGTGSTKSLTISNPNNTQTSSTIQLYSDATNNIIRYCQILGSNSSSHAAPSGTINLTTGSSVGNDNNNINNNDIYEASGGLPSFAIYSYTGSATYSNDNNTVDNNNIYNYFSTLYNASGIFLNAGAGITSNSNWTITNNKLYQTNDRNTATATNNYYGIRIGNTTANVTGGGFNISGNTIGFATSGSTGYTTYGPAVPNFGYRFTAIQLYISSTAASIQGNTISNIKINTISGATVIFAGISVDAGSADIGTITPNIIGSSSGTGAITCLTTNSLPVIYGINANSAGNVRIQSNTIASINTAISNTMGYTFYGINTTGAGVFTITSNTIGNTTANSISIGTATSTTGINSFFGINNSAVGTTSITGNFIQNAAAYNTNVATRVAGIVNSGGASINITSNTIHDLNLYNTTGACVLSGIENSGVTTANISLNRIYDLTTNITGAGIANGILIAGGTANNIFNNIIGNLKTSTATNNAASVIRGISIPNAIAGGAINVYYNTIFLSANSSGTGTDVSTSGIYHTSNATPTTSALTLRNNIIVNNSLPRGAGRTVAIQRSAYNNLGNYSANSNNNLLYAGTPGASNLIYYDVTNPSQNIAQFIAVAPLGHDAASVTEYPPFLNTTIGANADFLHFSNTCTTTPTVAESGGAIVGTYNTDFDTDPRYGNALYTGGGSAPDIGADEFGVNAIEVTTVPATGTFLYSNLKAAFDKINTGTHHGDITIRVLCSTVESASCVLNASGSGSALYSSVLMYPAFTGLSITGNLAAPLIDLNGADNVTIDGSFNHLLGGADLTISNTSIAATAGTSTIRFIAGATSNNVQYCLLRGSSADALGGIVSFSAIPANSGNTIDNCNITNAGGNNRPYNVICSPNTVGYNNSNNIISNNIIYDFFKPTVSSNGIYIAASASAWTISGNRFYETTSFDPNTGFTFSVININTTSGINFNINNNNIGCSTSSCSATTWTKTATNLGNNTFYGIYLQNVGTMGVSTVQDNTIHNFNWKNAGTAFGWYGINIGGGFANIQGNTIAGITTNTSAPADACNFYGINKTGAGTTTIIGNNINSINASSLSTGNAQVAYGIYSNGIDNITINSNTIANLTNSTNNILASTAGSINGINTSTGVYTISNNIIRDLTIANSNTNKLNTPSIAGIIQTSTTGGQSVYGNTIYNLSNTYSTFSGGVIGLYYAGGILGTNTVYNNFIYGLNASSTNTAASIYGIKINTGVTTYYNNIISLGFGITTGYNFCGIYDPGAANQTCNLYFNTVYIGGAAAGTTSSTYGLYNFTSSNTRNYRNNIFSNERQGGATGKHYAISLPSGIANLTIDYNDYYAPNGVLGNFNALDRGTLLLWQGSTTKDGFSKNDYPNFTTPGGTSSGNYLPKNTTLYGVSVTGITTDYPGINRCVPTMGAFEVIVTPAITAMATTVCSGTGFSETPANGVNGTVPVGTTYTWPAPIVTGGLTGGAAGTNAISISGTLTNPTNTIQTATYTVTPTLGSCPGSTFTVTVTVNPKPAISNITANACSAVGFTVTPVDGANGIVPVGTTYSWAAPTGTGFTGGAASSGTPTSISGTLTNTTNTVQTAIYTVTPTSGSCTGSTFTVTVTINPKPAISDMTATVCSAVGFTVTPVNGTNGIVPAGTTYSWAAPAGTGFTGGAASSGSPTSISGTLTNITNAVQTAIYTVTPTSGSCTGSTFTVTVTINPKPAISNMTATVCSAVGFTVTPVDATNGIVPAGTTYTWLAPTGTGFTGGAASSGTPTSISGTLTNTTNTVQTAIYTVTPTSGSCSGSTFTVTVTINPKPAISNMTTTICSTVGFTVTPVDGTNGIVPAGTTYTWLTPTGTGFTGGTASTGTPTSISGTLTNTTNTVQTAIYTVTSTSGSCTGSTFTVTVTINPKPAITNMTATVCSAVGFTVTPVDGTNGIVPVGTTYSWAVPTGTGFTGGAASSGTPTSISGTLTNTTNVVHTAIYTVTPTSGSCAGNTFTVTITVNPAPTGSDVIQTPCSGDNFIYNLTASIPSTFTWVISSNPGGITGALGGSGPTINQTLVNPSNSANGTVVYRVTPTSIGNLCVGATFDITVIVQPQPAVTVAPIPNPTYCSGAVVPAINFTSSTGGGTFAWTSLTDIGFGTSGTGNIPSFTVSNITGSPISTTVSVRATYAFCLGPATTFSIIINPAPVVSITADYCLNPGHIILTASPLGQPGYQWYNSGITMPGETTNTLDVTLAGNYSVAVTNSYGCATTTVLAVASELVTNGNFTAGNSGFTSDYFYQPDVAGNTELVNDAVPINNGYGIGTNGQNYHNNFWGPDHTNNTVGPRNFMIVNGHGTLVVWRTAVPITVVPLTTYYFSAWAISLNSAGPFANLQFNINGSTNGMSQTSTGPLPSRPQNNNPPFNWTQFYGNWTAPLGVTTANLEIVDLIPSLPGNDFGIDDISFGSLSAIPATMSPSANGNGTVCEGGTLTLNANITGGIPPYTITWTNPLGVTIPPTNQQIVTVSNVTSANAGNYTVSVSDGYGCPPHTQTVNVVVTPIVGTPVFTLGATSTRCQGAGSITYTATATNTTGITYTLDATSTTGGNSINPSTGAVTYLAGWSGTSIITASASGCGGPLIATHTVTITPTVGIPVFVLGATSSICQPAGTITYTANASNSTGITYSLDAASLTGGNSINSATGEVIFGAGWSGISIITAIAAGCNGPSAAATHTVTINALPVAPTLVNSTNNNFCADDAGNITLTVTGGSGDALNWYTTCPGTILYSGSSYTIPSPTVTTTYYATYSNGCGTSTCTSITITVHDLPVAPTSATATPNHLCAGASLTLEAIGGNGGTGLNPLLQWYSGSCLAGTPVGTGTPLPITAPATPTTYYARWESGCGNSACVSVAVTIDPLPAQPSPIVGLTQVCVPATGVGYSVNPVAGATGYVWSYSDPDGTIASGAGTNSITIDFATIASPGSGTLSVYAVNGCGNSAAQSVLIRTYPASTVDAGPDQSNICAGQTVQLNGTVVGTTSFVWSGGAGTYNPDEFTLDAIYTPDAAEIAAGTVTLTLTATQPPPCPAVGDNMVITIQPLPVVSSPPSVCVGSTINLTPAVGGTWTSSNPVLATVTNAGVVTGVTAGSVTFTFTQTATGCSNTTSSVTVNARPNVTAPASVCVGSTGNLTPAAGGTWTSSNPAIATVTNAGVITGITAGSVTFTFTRAATGCSNTTASVTVNARPVVTSPAAVCVGSTGNLTPAAGGTWTSSNPAVATVTNAGVITGLIAGSVTFTFTLTATGCTNTTSSVTINARPLVTAPAAVCVGSTGNLTPAAGGTWTSSNPAVATVTNAGVITGVTAGSVTFTYTLTATGCTNTTASVTINAQPVVTAPATVCVGSTGNLTPAAGGTWTSSNPAVATVTNAGVITGVSAGNVTFTFTLTATGCTNTTPSVTVNAQPAVTAPASVCVGNTGNLTPAAGGTWTSSNPAVATVTNAGVVSGVAAGSVSFTFTLTATGCTNTTPSVTINAQPAVTAPASVCVGSTINLTPAIGGTWVSSNNAIATVTNAGLVTGVASGNVTFTFTLTATGCSNTTTSVTVNPLPGTSAVYHD